MLDNTARGHISLRNYLRCGCIRVLRVHVDFVKRFHRQPHRFEILVELLLALTHDLFLSQGWILVGVEADVHVAHERFRIPLVVFSLLLAS